MMRSPTGNYYMYSGGAGIQRCFKYEEGDSVTSRVRRGFEQR